MQLEEIVKHLADVFEKEGNAKAIFGEPVKLESKTVIPVALLKLGGGVGGGAPTNSASTIARALSLAGGGGLDVSVIPVGFIHERHSEVVFTPIHMDVKTRPFLEMSSGLGRMIGAISASLASFSPRTKTAAVRKGNGAANGATRADTSAR